MASSTPRHRHNREEVLEAAEAIVDRDGWQALTMTSLAAELDVKVPSLYNHVPNLETLRGELQNRTLHAIGLRLRDAAMGKTGEPAMRALAATLREYTIEHAGRYDLAMRAPIDRDGFLAATVDAGAALRAVIASYGIADDDTELQLSIFAALHGVLVLDITGFFEGAADADAIYEQVLNALLVVLDVATASAAAG